MTTAATPATAAPTASELKILKHKRRFCRAEGCTRIVKSQGLCQRHGAKPKTCKVEGCEKQAQGNFDRMCKAHFKAIQRKATPLPKVDTSVAPASPEGSSVYENVLPSSISYIPSPQTKNPLVAHLKAGFDDLKPPAWHRNEERRARGLVRVDNPATQLEGWERELVWMEVLVLTGAPSASFRHLARAWGRDKGFHMVLAQFICERQGDVRRKKRHRGTKSGEKNKAPKKQRIAREKSAEDASADTVENISDENDDFNDIDKNSFADDIFNFTVEEFEDITSNWSITYAQQSSSGGSAAATLTVEGEGDFQLKEPPPGIPEAQNAVATLSWSSAGPKH
ncbi:MAG: hypothetical protein SGBAC_012121 [Bacillariaceae sp.]